MVVTGPICVQVLPSTDTYPLNVLAALTSFSHIGTLRSLILVRVTVALVAERLWNPNEPESELTPVRA
jgi:hypothetical protein